MQKPRTRLYLEGEVFSFGAAPALKEAQIHYLLHTLRVREGETLLVFNGKQGEWLARVAKIFKKNVRLEITEQRREQKNVPPIDLIFAPVKNDKIDFLVKRAVELGVRSVQPVMTQYTVVSRINMERLRTNAVEAAEQCGRMDIPLVLESQTLPQLLSRWDPDTCMLYCDEDGKGQPVRVLLPALETGKAYAVLTGPEGGFSAEERGILRAQPYIKALSLGPRILRAETAALAALANIQAWLGDWQEQPLFNN